MRRLVVILAAALAVFAIAAPAYAGEWNKSGVRVASTLEVEAPGWMTVDASAAGLGVAHCAFNMGGLLYNTAEGSLGTAEGLEVYGCKDSGLPPGEVLKVRLAKEPAATFPLFAGAGVLELTELSGEVEYRSPLVLAAVENRNWTLAGAWEDGSCAGVCASWWHFTGEAKTPTGAAIKFSGKARVLGLQGLELLTLKGPMVRF